MRSEVASSVVEASTEAEVVVLRVLSEQVFERVDLLWTTLSPQRRRQSELAERPDRSVPGAPALC